MIDRGPRAIPRWKHTGSVVPSGIGFTLPDIVPAKRLYSIPGTE